METAIIPVETVLKVNDKGFLAEKDKVEDSICVSSINYGHSGNQSIWPEKLSNDEMSSIGSDSDRDATKNNPVNADKMLLEGQANKVPLFIRGWTSERNSTISLEPKLILPASFSQEFSCNIQSLPVDENYFLQFDYKTRNKLKTKQRRLDPFYRNQERMRQRTVMRIKRQDPRFRAAEREKGRCRMRIKRLDPVFRSKERERQRERMKLKRSDPDFREKERERQKVRLGVKRSHSSFGANGHIQETSSLQIKHANIDIYATSDSEPEKLDFKIDCQDVAAIQSKPFAFQEDVNFKLAEIKSYDQNLETFHFKKQKILNFNFYNCNKGQWALSVDKNEKMNQLPAEDNIKCETIAQERNSCSQNENQSLTQRETNSKLVSQSFMDLKSKVSYLENDENSQKLSSSSVPSYSFSSASSKVSYQGD